MKASLGRVYVKLGQNLIGLFKKLDSLSKKQNLSVHSKSNN